MINEVEYVSVMVIDDFHVFFFEMSIHVCAFSYLVSCLFLINLLEFFI